MNPRPSARSLASLLFALALAAALLAYWPGLAGGYVFDDFGNLVDNPAFAPAALHAQGFWHAVWSAHAGPLDRPLAMASFAAQAWFTGLDPRPLKLVNVLIHLLNGGLIWLLSLRVLRWLAARGDGPKLVSADTLALLVAAAWVLAPIHLTAVLYVIQREESLAATLVLLWLLAYWHGRMRLIAGRRWARAWLWGSLGLGTLLAALVKETGVMLPAYALVLEWVVLRGQLRPSADTLALLRTAPASATPPRHGNPLLPLYGVLLVLPAALGLAWLLPGILNGSAYAARPFTLAERLLTEGRVMVDYLRWILLPTPNALSLYHDDVRASTGWLQPWTTAASWALLAALLASALWGWRRWPLWSLGVLWFFAGQSLVSTFVPLELVYEHRNYLPSWGVFLAAFGLLTAWSPPDAQRHGTLRLLVVGGLTALIALQGFFTFLRAQVWGNPYRLAYFEATTHPESPRANYDLGRLSLIISHFNPDSPLYRLGVEQVEQAQRVSPDSGLPISGLIFSAAKASAPIDPHWWNMLQRSVTGPVLNAQSAQGVRSLVNGVIDGTLHFSPTDRRRLQTLLDAMLRAHPDNGAVISMVANDALNVQHDANAGYRLLLRNVAVAPDSYQAWKNLFDIQLAAGLYGDAANVLQRLRELDRFGIHRAEIARLAAALKQRERAAAASPPAAPAAAAGAAPTTATAQEAAR